MAPAARTVAIATAISVGPRGSSGCADCERRTKTPGPASHQIQLLQILTNPDSCSCESKSKTPADSFSQPRKSNCETSPPLTVPATAEAESRDPFRLLSKSTDSADAEAGAGSMLGGGAGDDSWESPAEGAGAWQQSVCAPARGAIDRVWRAPCYLQQRSSPASPVLQLLRLSLGYQTYSEQFFFNKKAPKSLEVAHELNVSACKRENRIRDWKVGR